MPKSVWPTIPVTVGKAVTAAEFVGAVRSLRIRSRCLTCSGKGTVMVERTIDTAGYGGSSRSITTEEQQVTCPKCLGEGLMCQTGVYGLMKRVAEDVVGLQTTPDADAKAARSPPGRGATC